MKNKKRIALILAGSGQSDGSEIHEAVCAMLAIDMNGAEYYIFAPDKPQYHVINHFTGEVMNETRNILIESARMARGKAKSLELLNISEYDALILPGGNGAAKNLSDYAFKGAEMQVDPMVAECITRAHEKSIPIGAMCISPMMLAKVLPNVQITLGGKNDAMTAAQKLGAQIITTNAGEVCVDIKNKIVTTPCYMVNSTIGDVLKGADSMVKEILKMLA